MQKISFNVEGQKLDGTLFYPEFMNEQNPAILFVQGWMGEKERSYQYAEALARVGFICFLFDTRGHGKSAGDMDSLTREDFLKDVVSAYNFLIHQMGVNPEKISVVGSSFGGYVSAILTSIKEVKNLVLRTPANYPNEGFDKPHKLQEGDNPTIAKWRNEPRKLKEGFSLEAINNFGGKVLIIQSEKDERVPPQTIKNYVNVIKDKSQLTHILIKDAPHSIKEGKFRDEITNVLVDWFKDKI